MTAKIHAVLLVPTDGDPLGLLRSGPCGARPPVVAEAGIASSDSGDVDLDSERWAMTHLGWRDVPWAHTEEHPECRRALVLAWGGAPVAEGMDRLGRSMNSKVLVFTGSMLACRVRGGTAHRRGLGVLVLLDADGREVSP